MILDRYLTKEIIPNILIGLLVFTFVMLMNQILVLAEILITRGVQFVMIFLIIFYSLPALTVLTIPMSLLLGVLLGLGRLNGDSELTVMRASGISLYRIALPILGVAIFCWLLCSYMIHVLVPWGNYSFSRLMFKVLTTNAASELKPRVFYNQFPNMVLYVQDISSKGNIWKGIFIFDESLPDHGRIVLSRYGTVQSKEAKELELELQNGSWHEVDPQKPEDYSFANFFQNSFPLPTPMQFTSGEIPKSDRDQTVAELKQNISENRRKGLPSRFLEVEIHKKYSIPFACIIFAFLALTLGVSSKKSSRSSAYAISIGIILVYYIFLIGGERLGDAGKISPFLAAWGGNLFLGALGILLFIQTNSSALTKVAQRLAALQRQRKHFSRRDLAESNKRIRVVIRVQHIPFRLFTLLDRYIVQEFLKSFVLILIALAFIAELIEAVQLVDDLFRNRVGIGTLMQYLKFHFPQWVFYVLPVTALTTTLVTFGGFTKNSEIIAMKSSGVSLYRVALPVIIVAAILSIFAFWLQDYILPATNKLANNYRRAIKGAPPETYTTFERHWMSSPDGFYNYDLYDPRKNVVYGFSIYQVDTENFDLQKRIYARKATYKDNYWYLDDGWQRSFKTERGEFEQFRKVKLRLPVNPEYFRAEQELPSEMTFRSLKQHIQKMKQRGYDFVRFAVDLHAKISFPAVSLILTLIAIPFSFTTGKRGALYGIGLSIFVGIVFWFFLALTKSLGYLEILNPFLAAWTPNILATLMALYLLFKLRT